MRVYVGAGRKAKVRPADLVGAIVNEAGIDPRAIGAIQITDRFSLVELPDEVADESSARCARRRSRGERCRCAAIASTAREPQGTPAGPRG